MTATEVDVVQVDCLPPPDLAYLKPEGTYKVGIQVGITLFLVYAIYMAYDNTGEMASGMVPASRHPGKRLDEMNTAMTLAGCLIFLISAIYVVLILKDCNMQYLS